MQKELIKVLKSVWTKEIKKLNTPELLFCSERHLQCELYKHLTIQLNKISSDFIVFVEPTMNLRVGRERQDTKPDLIIVHKQEIIGVIELKYTPNKYSEWERDFKKLKAFAKEIPKLNAKNRIKTKETSELVIESDAVCCFAVITKEDSMALEDDIWKGFPTESYLHLRGSIGKKHIFSTN